MATRTRSFQRRAHSNLAQRRGSYEDSDWESRGSLEDRYDEDDDDDRLYGPVGTHVAGGEITRITSRIDKLDRSRYAQALSSLIEEPKTETPLSIGLFSEWGSGKSGFLDLLLEHVQKKNKNNRQVTSVSFLSSCCLDRFVSRNKTERKNKKMYREEEKTDNTQQEQEQEQEEKGNSLNIGWVNIRLFPFLYLILCLIVTVAAISLTRYSSSLLIQNKNESQNHTINIKEVGEYIYLLLPIPFFCFLIFFLVLWRQCGQPGSHGFCTMLWKCYAIYYYFPIFPSEVTETELIVLRFNAWEYTGCQLIWAAIATELCAKIEEKFGKYPTRICRAIMPYFQDQWEMYQKKYQVSDIPDAENVHKKEMGESQFVTNPSGKILLAPYSKCNIPSEAMVVIVLFLMVIFIAVFIWYVQLGVLSAIIPLGITALGVALLEAFSFIKSIKNLLRGLGSDISKILMDSPPDLEEGLGIMHVIRNEMELLFNIIRYMELIEQKKFRILLLIDDLDRINREKIVSMLAAHAVIMSESRVPIVSVIATDPRNVIAAIKAHLDINKNEITEQEIQFHPSVNAYDYLRKIIHLVFWLPPITQEHVTEVLGSFVTSHESFSYAMDDPFLPDWPSPEGEDEKVKSNTTDPYITVMQSIRENRLVSILLRNTRSLKKLRNTLYLAFKLLPDTNSSEFHTHFAWWIILVEQWPFRVNILVWLHQNRNKIENIEEEENEDSSDSLLEISKTMFRYVELPADWRYLLSLDADEGDFNTLLEEYQFTMSHIDEYLKYTINLDQSIQHAIKQANDQKRVALQVIPSKVVLGTKQGPVFDGMTPIMNSPSNNTRYSKYFKYWPSH